MRIGGRRQRQTGHSRNQRRCQTARRNTIVASIRGRGAGAWSRSAGPRLIAKIGGVISPPFSRLAKSSPDLTYTQHRGLRTGELRGRSQLRARSFAHGRWVNRSNISRTEPARALSSTIGWEPGPVSGRSRKPSIASAPYRAIPGSRTRGNIAFAIEAIPVSSITAFFDGCRKRRRTAC